MPEWKPAGVYEVIAWLRALGPSALGSALLVAGLTAVPLQSAAQSADPETVTVEIPTQPLAQALEDFAHLTGLQIVYLASDVGAQKSHEVPAGLSAADALTRLLQGTGLHFEFLTPRVVKISPVTPSASEISEIVITAHMLGIPKPRPFPPATPDELLKMRLANEDLERQITRANLLYADPQLERYLHEVAERLLATDGTDAAEVHIRVLKGTDASVLTLSNGSIYLSTALLTGLHDEGELAAVLGRELTHYRNAHVLRGMRAQRNAWAAVVTSKMVLELSFGLLAAHYHTSLGSGDVMPAKPTLEIWVSASAYGYPRDLEWEADDGGMHRTVAAGYAPETSLRALHSLAEQAHAGGTDRPVYASRAKLDGRIASYQRLLEREFAEPGESVRDLSPSAYRAQLGKLPLDQVALLLEGGALERADAQLAADVAAAGDGGRAEFLKGEILRLHVPQTDETLAGALAAYERAVTLPGAPAAAYRESGRLHRLRGEPDAAAMAFRSYLEQAPGAVDAPLVRIYLEELGALTPVSEARP